MLLFHSPKIALPPQKSALTSQKRLTSMLFKIIPPCLTNFENTKAPPSLPSWGWDAMTKRRGTPSYDYLKKDTINIVQNTTVVKDNTLFL